MSGAASRAARPRHVRRRAAPDLFSHRTRHVQMNGLLSDSETLVVTFAPRATEASAIWGRAPLQTLGHSVLCFVDFADAWFPSADIAELKAKIEGKLARYRRIVTYGHSMGGYGALKYGSLFAATRSVGLGPAWSVTPQDVGQFDRRRPRLYYRPELHDGMAIRPRDLAKDAIVVFDPGHAEDYAHVMAMERAGCGVRRAPNHFVGHDLLSPCLETGHAGDFVAAIANGSGVAGLRGTIRASRGRSPRYVASALAALGAAGRTTSARRFAETYAMPLADKPAVREVLVRQNYAVPDLPTAHGWEERFETGTAEVAVAAAKTQTFAPFFEKPGRVRRWLSVHAEVGAFDLVNRFVAALIENDRWRGDEYTSFARAILMGGQTRAHYVPVDQLLAEASRKKHSAEKRTMVSIGADLVLRGETQIPSDFFASAYFVEAGDTERLALPPMPGEFLRSLPLDLPPGTFRIVFDITAQAADARRLTLDVLRKTGHSIRSPLRAVLAFFTLRKRGPSGRRRGDTSAVSLTVDVPKPRKRREPRVNIILKSDGSGAGGIILFHGVHIVRV